MGIGSGQLIADFRRMLAEKWGYIPSTSGETWTKEKQEQAAAKSETVARYGGQWIGHRVADCSGAFVWAYRQHGMSIYHGSNRIAREYVGKAGARNEERGAVLLPISEAKPGMAAFKVRRPGQKGYELPDEYRQGGGYYNGDLNDYYHIGLVDGDPRYVINAQGTRTGVVRSNIADGWACVAELKAVEYEEGNPVERLYWAVVTAENGKPVNLRKAPSINAARIAALPVGTEVAVLNEADADWAEVQAGDKTGYMMRKFLQKRQEDGAEEILEQISRLLEEAQALVAQLRSRE